MCQTVSTYYLTVQFNLKLFKYTNKKTELNQANL